MKKLPAITKAIIFSITLLSVGVYATTAWLYNANSSNVNSFSGNVIDENLTEISGNGEDWGFTLGFGTGEQLFAPVAASMDLTTFYKQKIDTIDTKVTDVYGNETTITTQYVSGYEALSAPTGYMSVTDFKMRNSQANKRIVINVDQTRLFPDKEMPEGEVSGVNIPGGSIAGAARVALLKKIKTTAENGGEENGEPTEQFLDEYKPLFVWAPNAAYELSGSDTDGYRFNANGNAEAAILFRTGSQEEETASVAIEGTDGMSRDEETNILYLWGDLTKIEGLAETSIDVSGESNEETDYRLLIWVDGMDRECKDLMQGGRFNLKIQFSAK